MILNVFLRAFNFYNITDLRDCKCRYSLIGRTLSEYIEYNYIEAMKPLKHFNVTVSIKMYDVKPSSRQYRPRLRSKSFLFVV